MANEENLKPFKKGQSGNPKGREKGSRNRSTIAKHWLEMEEMAKNPITGVKERMQQQDIMTLALIKKARSGDVQAYKELMDSSFGKALQKTENLNVDMTALTKKEIDQAGKKLDSEY